MTGVSIELGKRLQFQLKRGTYETQNYVIIQNNK